MYLNQETEKNVDHLFDRLSAWFSTSVPPDAKSLWLKNGGVLKCKEMADFHFADCSAVPDVLPLFNSEKYTKQELTVIKSDWIKGVVKIGNRKSSDVPLGEYILPHPSVAEEIARFLKGYPGEIQSSKAPVKKARSKKKIADTSYDPWAFTDEETETKTLPKRRRSCEVDMEIFPREMDRSLPGPSQCKVAEPDSSINDCRKGEYEHGNKNLNRDQGCERKTIKTSSSRHLMKDFSEKKTKSLKNGDQHCEQEGNCISPKKKVSSYKSQDNRSKKTVVVNARGESDSDQEGNTTCLKATSPSYHLKYDKIKKKAVVKKVEDHHGEQDGIVSLPKMTVIVTPINHKSQVLETKVEDGDLKGVMTGSKTTKMSSPRSKKRQGGDFGDQHCSLNEIMTRSKGNSTSYDSKIKSVKETSLGETSHLSQQGIGVKKSDSLRETICKRKGTENIEKELGSSSQEHMEKTNRKVTKSVTMDTKSHAEVPKTSSALGSFTTSMSGGYIHLDDLVLPDIEIKDFYVSKPGISVSLKKT